MIIRRSRQRLSRGVEQLERSNRRLRRELADTFQWEEEEIKFLLGLLDGKHDQPWNEDEERLVASIREKLG